MAMKVFAAIFIASIITMCVNGDEQKAPASSHPFNLIDGVIESNGIKYYLKYAYDHVDKKQQKETTAHEEDQLQCSAVDQGSFSVYDYAVVGFMLIVSLGIGVFYGFFDKSASAATSESSNDFMLGSGMTIFPVTLSLTTSFITAIELLGNPAEMYFNGAQYALIIVAMLLVIPVALKVFYPIYDSMKLTSCYEYLGVRFGKELRVFGGCLYILQMCFYTSVSVLAPSIALSKATGIDTRLAIVLIYIVCIFYSSQGGLKAVVIADTFQTCVLVVSLLLVLVLGTYMQDGGIAAIFKINQDRGRLNIFDFDPNPTTRHTVWSVVIGGFFYWASLLCVNQATVQKAMSLKNLTKAKIALTLSIVGLATLFFINFYTGFMMFAHYENCDPFKAGKIGGIDQLMPFYIMDTFGHFTAFSGIFVAGVFSASLGTVAACLSSLSAVTLEDLCISGMNVKISPQDATRYAKWLNFGYGVVSFGLIFLVEGRGILQATLTLNGLIGGIALGLFSLGIFFKCANLKGALYGGLLSTIMVVTLGIFALTADDETEYLESSVTGCSCALNATLTAAANIDESTAVDHPWYVSIYKVSYMWYSMIGTLLTIVFGLAISVITQWISDMRIKKLSENQIPKNNDGVFKRQDAERKISTICHDASAKIENTIRRAMSNSHLPHLHSNLHAKGSTQEDTLNIVNEASIQTIADLSPLRGASVIQMFDDGKQFQGIDNLAVDLSHDDIDSFKK